MLQTKYHLLAIDLNLFGEGGEGAAAPAGEAGAPAAEAAPAEVRYGIQAEQTPAPQQTPSEAPVDKGKQFSDLIKGEFKDQYTEATQKLINRRFRETDQKIQSMQPVIDMLDQRYGTQGDMTKLMAAIEGDRAYWQDAADEAGMTVEQYQKMQQYERQIRQYRAMQQQTQNQYLANLQYRQWQTEAEALKQKYPAFDLNAAQQNDMFMTLLRNKYPMEEAYKAAFADQIASQASASAEKAVIENIRARGNRPTEAGSSATPAFTVKDDVSKLSDQDILAILKEIGNGKRVTFG